MEILAQAPTIAATITLTPTPTPTVQTDSLSKYTSELFGMLTGFDAIFALKVIGFWMLIIWLVFVIWVAIDALQRYKNPVFAIFWFLFVLPFNLPGFIGYLFIRPHVTLEEKEWTKLEAKYLMYELSHVNDCPSCKNIVPEADNYCPTCGYQMNVKCEKCEHVQSIYNAHCVNCGHKIKTQEVVVQSTVSVPTNNSPMERVFVQIDKLVDGTIAKAKQIKSKIALPKKAEKKAVEAKTSDLKDVKNEKPQENKQTDPKQRITEVAQKTDKKQEVKSA